MPYVVIVEQGVDDFIMKPCGVREVMACSRAMMRRAGRAFGIGGGRESWGHSSTGGSSQRKDVPFRRATRNSRPCHRNVTF